MVKVVFINNGMTHYYNLVLSRLNSVPGMELTLVAPGKSSRNIGAGVYQTREGVNFTVKELREFSILNQYSSFKGLAAFLLRERPDVVIVGEPHLFTFLFDIFTILVMRFCRIGLILKSIPFRIPLYAEAKDHIRASSAPADDSRVPSLGKTIIHKLGLQRFARTVLLELRRIAYNIPDAHVDYIDEAYGVFGSYGVKRDRIFIIRNSPDTDLLFKIRSEIENAPAILPQDTFRLIHVGRLVEWKRVDMLMRAFRRLERSISDSELLVIGNGPEEASLKTLSMELGIQGKTRFLGGVHDPKLLGRYLIASSVYVLAGMGGLSINDAMCFGLPIICSVCDGTEKILVRDEYNGKYFKDGDEDDLLDKILYLARSPELCKEMGRNSTEIIRRDVNINTVITGYLHALEYVVSGKRKGVRVSPRMTYNVDKEIS